jgi:hypothetical protein
MSNSDGIARLTPLPSEVRHAWDSRKLADDVRERLKEALKERL